MAKDNIFLGMGRGAVGDVVLSRVGGQQVARVRNRNPRNPRSPLQLAQRVVMKTNSLAYSLVQEISNHAFQGVAEGTPSQSVFSKRNVQLLRTVVAEEINSGDTATILNSVKTNYASATDSWAPINPYLLSEGHIPPLRLEFVQAASVGYRFRLSASLDPQGTTYAGLVSALGLQKGDQLTFCFFSYDDVNGGYTFNGFHYARVILEPANGDMSVPFLNGSVINQPNPKNEGDVTLAQEEVAPGEDSAGLLVSSPRFPYTVGQPNTLVGAAVIVSRLSGGLWARSTQNIVLRPNDGAGGVTNDYNAGFFGDAVQSFMTSVNSSLYLNQATD